MVRTMLTQLRKGDVSGWDCARDGSLPGFGKSSRRTVGVAAKPATPPF